jgi:hypothetical protein
MEASGAVSGSALHPEQQRRGLGYMVRCVHRPMTDTIPDGWRTVFRRHGGHRSGVKADSLDTRRIAVRHDSGMLSAMSAE